MGGSFDAVEPDVSETESASTEHYEDVIPEDIWLAKFETTKGEFVIEVHPEWAPRGAQRFRELIESGVFDGVKFFRVVDGFMAQFGISGDPEVSAKWRVSNIPDDPVVESNTRGTITFANAGPGTRTSQVFINFADNSFLDQQGFPPFGKVIEGMDVVDSLYSGYGDAPPNGNGPNQQRIQEEGNAYLEKEFPELDAVIRATVIEKPASDAATDAAEQPESEQPQAEQPQAEQPESATSDEANAPTESLQPGEDRPSTEDDADAN